MKNIFNNKKHKQNYIYAVPTGVVIVTGRPILGKPDHLTGKVRHLEFCWREITNKAKSELITGGDLLICTA